jgi:uncharacterized membrane protein (UPF0182 family)
LESFDEQLQKWFPEEKQPAKRKRRGLGLKIFTGVVIFVALIIIANVAKGFYSEWLWFQSLGYEQVYTTMLQTKLAIFFTSAIIVFLFIMGNLMLANRLAPHTGLNLMRSRATLPLIIGIAVLSLIFGLVAQGGWMTVLQFFNGQPFGIQDPIFNKELSFYVFTLPYLELIRGWLMAMFITSLIGIIVLYVFSYLAHQPREAASRPVLGHTGGLFIGILALFAWGYRLDIWNLVYSPRGVVFGASYADIHAGIPAQWTLLVIVILFMALVLFAIWRRRLRLIFFGLGGWVFLAIIVGLIYPAIVQRFQVQPNELALETPYISYNIEFTREAFGLNNIEEQSFPADPMPTREDIKENEVTVDNIRLWDHRPLKDTYNQIQSIRLYYDFDDVDIDRYTIDDQYRQVMLSARELSAEKLTGQAQTWVNRQLQFTHGYGVVMSPVNEISAEGLPSLILKDIPPVGDLKIDRPEIYFGEKTNNHVIVKTNTEEFDYPKGDDNVYGQWQGDNGINISTFLRRFIYAWQLNDFNILISSEITPQSQLLYYRNIQERVSHLAPFLKLDDDPYLVISEGKLYWIQDAYTITNRYPYSEPYSRDINYIRNSVKVVIDAYDGSVTFYVINPDDTLIQTYEKIFPGMFTSIDKLPDSLRVHLRYPEGMFNIQAAMYQSYHMRDARVFYNKEDLWAIPKEVYAGTEQTIEPYYVIMRLPSAQSEEFLLMLPFTPVNKNNTIGWLAARCDGEHYGKMLAYYFPKERLVYGPSQIENRIQQDTIITEQLALWSRGGSRVIRGNLLMIPLDKSNLYVEPVFLQADAGGLPELKRVIVAAGDRIAMTPSLQASIDGVFGVEVPPVVEIPPAKEPVTPEQKQPEITPTALSLPAPVDNTINTLIEQAQQHYNKAQDYLKTGDWAGYGREMDALEKVLNQLAALSAKQGE